MVGKCQESRDGMTQMVNKPQNTPKRRKLRAVILPTWQVWLAQTGQAMDAAQALFGLTRRQTITLMQRDPDAITALAMSAAFHRQQPWV